MKILAYHSDSAVKARHVALAVHHRDADMLVSGTYGQTAGGAFRGCSVGCMAHDIAPKRRDHHEVVAEDAGWPEWLVRLNDSIFEGLPTGKRENFHVELREAIAPGVDLESVRPMLAIRRIDRLITLQNGNLGRGVDDVVNQTIAALQQVRRAHEAEIGDNVCLLADAEKTAAWSAESARSAAESAAESARSAAESARSAAESAAWSAAAWSAWSAAESARSAAWSAAESARSAAWSAESAAWSAAWSAESAESAARSAARSAAWVQEADDLLEILRELVP